MKYCKIITTIMIPDEVKMACLLVPITPATIKQITIADIAGK